MATDCYRTNKLADARYKKNISELSMAENRIYQLTYKQMLATT